MVKPRSLQRAINHFDMERFLRATVPRKRDALKRVKHDVLHSVDEFISVFGKDDEDWYHKLGVTGIYTKAANLEYSVYYTILREDLDPFGNISVVWDSYNKNTPSPLVNAAWKHGIELHGLLIMEDELEESFTILIEAEERRAVRLQVSPLEGKYRKIFDLAKASWAGLASADRIFDRPIPRDLLESENEDEDEDENESLPDESKSNL
ncbi:hypothetical protein J4E83_009841 [Alternaria metachromatica]|uniref:uncharacterized protein n=1 Tax=Alternaria metachromatica TaxID=283354 RepID=UPI0020C4BFDB|nr:uncharacterized protein J4E83_009841 [Alternaria metachromatica]KAI4606930.1 hypothetical protein J4E83_009841 [Alternaria metachromatica]